MTRRQRPCIALLLVALCVAGLLAMRLFFGYCNTHITSCKSPAGTAGTGHANRNPVSDGQLAVAPS